MKSKFYLVNLPSSCPIRHSRKIGLFSRSSLSKLKNYESICSVPIGLPTNR